MPSRKCGRRLCNFAIQGIRVKNTRYEVVFLCVAPCRATRGMRIMRSIRRDPTLVAQKNIAGSATGFSSEFRSATMLCRYEYAESEDGFRKAGSTEIRTS